MGVYIKGMEMPKNCAECPCRMIGYTKDHCNVLGKFIDFVVGSEGRREDCPLIEIPDGHGRLIDADALMNDRWTLHKQVMRMGGYAIHEMPLDNPNVSIVIPADKDGET